MQRYLLAVTAFASALILGCGDQSVTDPDREFAPSLAAEVSRFVQPLVVFFGQADPPLAAHLGVSPEDFPAFCEGAEPEAVADAMIVTHPTKQGGTSEHVLITAKELSALVWQVDVGEPGVDICQLEPSRLAPSTSPSTTMRVNSSRPLRARTPSSSTSWAR